MHVEDGFLRLNMYKDFCYGNKTYGEFLFFIKNIFLTQLCRIRENVGCYGKD